MHQRTAPQPVVFLVVAALGFLLLGSVPALDDRLLFKIERQQPGVTGADVLADVTGMQELESGWIAEAPSTVVARLREAGVALTVLDPAPSGKHYFLVFASAPGDLAGLPPLGSVVPLEDRVVLVASADDRLRERLPAPLSLAPLTFSPPAVIRPAFAATGRARAVPRGRAAAAAEIADPRIAQLVSQVSGERLGSIIRTLESYQSRYATTTNLVAAGNYLFDELRPLGLQVEYDDFTFTTAAYPAANIVATIPGRTSPRETVIIGAHYDSYSDQRPALAPGADDNASGTAAVLEAARALAAERFDFTVKLIAFSAEEWGLYGSRHYAQVAASRGDRIIGVVNLDMIGYTDQVPEDLDVIANPDSEWLADLFAATTAAYVPLPILKTVSASNRSSDHAPFWDQGYSAVMCIEDLPLKNPYYHKTTDTFETLNMSFATSAARAAVAVVANLAQPVSALATPADLVVQADTIRSLFARTLRNVLQWTASPQAAGYNVYRATTSHGTYRRVNGSRVTTTSFADGFVPLNISSFYVVTAVDAQGRESNYSAEVAGR